MWRQKAEDGRGSSWWNLWPLQVTDKRWRHWNISHLQNTSKSLHLLPDDTKQKWGGKAALFYTGHPTSDLTQRGHICRRVGVHGTCPAEPAHGMTHGTLKFQHSWQQQHAAPPPHTHTRLTPGADLCRRHRRLRVLCADHFQPHTAAADPASTHYGHDTPTPRPTARPHHTI